MNDEASLDIKGHNHNTNTEFILIISTASNTDEAGKIAGILVGEQVAACVSISSPVTSVYRWKSNVETEQEVMLFIKTVKSNYKTVERLIRQNHSYEVPEIIFLPIISGEGKYLQWISDNTKKER